MRHSTEILTVIRTDGDTNARILRIKDTGAANTRYKVAHELGRVPVAVEIILSDKDCRVYKGDTWTAATIDLKFTAANADVNIRIW